MEPRSSLLWFLRHHGRASHVPWKNDPTANVCAARGTQMNRNSSNSEATKPGSGAGGGVYLQGTNPATVGGTFSKSNNNSSATTGSQLVVASNVAEGRGNTGRLFDNSNHTGTTTGAQLGVTSNVAGGDVNDIQASDESQKENEKLSVAAGKPSHKRRRMN